MRPGGSGFAKFVATIVALALAFTFVRWWDFTVSPPGGARYQAIFLTNGQTYFGHYRDRLGPYVQIEDAYYIQSTPNSDPDKAAESKLVRRGGELHRPEPWILIPKSALLFVEDLRPESPVAQFMDKGGP